MFEQGYFELGGDTLRIIKALLSNDLKATALNFLHGAWCMFTYFLS